MNFWNNWVEALVRTAVEAGYHDVNVKDFGALPVVIEIEGQDRRVLISGGENNVVVHLLDDVEDDLHLIYQGKPQIVPIKCLDAIKNLLPGPSPKPR